MDNISQTKTVTTNTLLLPTVLRWGIFGGVFGALIGTIFKARVFCMLVGCCVGGVIAIIQVVDTPADIDAETELLENELSRYFQ